MQVSGTSPDNQALNGACRVARIRDRAKEVTVDAEVNCINCDGSEGEKRAQLRLVLMGFMFQPNATGNTRRGIAPMRDTWV